MKSYKLTIELKSDLCPGSGFDYAGVIDSDVCSDEYGIPYIPARRLKGCFRETAETILNLSGAVCRRLFGISGDNRTKGFIIKNAYPEGTKEMRKALRDAEIRNPERVLEQFTSVRAQTKLEEGIAKDDTLRYTRVIDCRNPVMSGNVKFVSGLFCEEADYDILKKIVRSTKNIGMHRNRGLGSVRCTLEPSSQGNDDNDHMAEAHGREKEDNNQMCEIRFTVKNTDPLEISAESDERSLTYINGASVRGCLASNYFRMVQGASVPEFERIFLSETIFNNLYPSKNHQRYEPVPLCLRKLKKTKDLVNLIAPDEHKPEKDSGNRPQKIKNGFVRIVHENSGYQFDETETRMELQYHHRTEKKQQGQDEQLYILETVAPGQLFTGTILTPYRNAELIKRLLEEGYLSFGKSKSAQYGGCILVGNVKMDHYAPEPVHDRDNRYLITFVSDGMFQGECGEYTTNREEVTAAVIEELANRCGYKADQIRVLGGPNRVIQYPSGKTGRTDNAIITQYLETRMVYGYNTMWNLKRSSMPAVSAGSCLAVEVSGGENLLSELYVGERQQEGFGHLRIFTCSDMTYRPIPFDEKRDDQNKAGVDTDKISDDFIKSNRVGYNLLHSLFLEDLRTRVLKDAFSGSHMKIGKTALGRATLMLRESYHTASQKAVTQNEFLKEFSERYNSIKTDSVRNEVKKFAEESKKVFDSCVAEFEANSAEYKFKLSEEEAAELLYRFLLTGLTAEKYHQKNAEKGGADV